MKRIWLIPIAFVVMSMLWTGVALAGSPSETAASELAGYDGQAREHDGEACPFKSSTSYE